MSCIDPTQALEAEAAILAYLEAQEGRQAARHDVYAAMASRFPRYVVGFIIELMVFRQQVFTDRDFRVLKAPPAAA